MKMKWQIVQDCIADENSLERIARKLGISANQVLRYAVVEEDETRTPRIRKPQTRRGIHRRKYEFTETGEEYVS
jgi:transposase-like protein